MFCALLMSRYQVSVYRTNGPLVFIFRKYISHKKEIKVNNLTPDYGQNLIYPQLV